MSANVYVIEDYENEPPSGSKKTKPKQTQSNPILVDSCWSLSRTEFTPHFDAGMRGCGAGMTMLEDNA